MSLDQRIDRLKKECVGKRRYATEKIAGIVRENVFKERKVYLRVYACGICAGFHLTKVNAAPANPVPPKPEGVCKAPDCVNMHKKDKDFCGVHSLKPKPPAVLPVSEKKRCRYEQCPKRKLKHNKYCGDHIHLELDLSPDGERARLIKAGILKASSGT